MLGVVIVGLTQEMNFETKVTTTYAVIRLPDTTTVRAVLDDEAAAAVVRVAVQEHAVPAQQTIPAPAPTFERQEERVGDPDVVIFGELPPVETPIAVHHLPLEAPRATPPTPAPVRKARTVQKDEYGYPIVTAGVGEMDPTRVTGTSGGDEDGVPSV